MTRPDARAQALGALYAADVLGTEGVDVEHLGGRAAALATTTWDHREDIDAAIDAASTRWRIDRMPAIDRTILRLGVYELIYTDMPVGVVISEAVELAKTYSTAKSGSFVNGVLSAIATAGGRSTRV
jgi:N utilization substance protein B